MVTPQTEGRLYLFDSIKGSCRIHLMKIAMENELVML